MTENAIKMADSAKDPVRARIRQLSIERGVSFRSLSVDVLKKNPSYLQNYMSKGSPADLETLDAVKLAKALDVAPSELGVDMSELSGAGKVIEKSPTGRVAFVHGEAVFSGPEDLPILGHVKAGEVGLFIDQGVTQGVTMRPKALIGVRDAYAVRVQDDSMFPAYEPDDLVFVNPLLDTRPGHNVVIQTVASEAFIKRLTKKGAKGFVCKQWNPEKEIEFSWKDVTALHRIVRLK